MQNNYPSERERILAYFDSMNVKPLTYANLTPKAKELICNGCGAKAMLIKPPDFIFSASCNQHDFKYWRGGNRQDRLEADFEFKMFMDKDVMLSGFKRKYRLWSSSYYHFVRSFGWCFFSWRKNKKGFKELALKMFDEGLLSSLEDVKSEFGCLMLR